MMPEDTVRAHKDLGGMRLFPIHWGAFVLALHPWAESVQRAQKAAQVAKVELVSAQIGEALPIPPLKKPAFPWWDDYLRKKLDDTL
jgi:L-ascorbate metabolism protein UlaG (beta-lactamase superfamily)